MFEGFDDHDDQKQPREAEATETAPESSEGQAIQRDKDEEVGQVGG